MSNIKAKLKTFFNVFLSHPMCVSNGIILALTTGFEQAWEEVVFKCPKKEKVPWDSSISTNQCYSLMFIAAPAVALWILGILGSNMAWRLCQGLKSRKDSGECSCINCGVIALRTFMIPLTWIFVALMDGDFYACFFYLLSCPEDPSSAGLVDGVNCTKNITVWDYHNKAESQLIGWLFLAVCLVFALIAVFCGRYFSKRTHFPHLYSNKLKKGERMQLENLLMEQAKKDAKRNVGAFMMKFPEFSTSNWESICTENTEKEYQFKKVEGESFLYPSPLSEFLANHPDELLKTYDLAQLQKKTKDQAQENQNPEPQPTG